MRIALLAAGLLMTALAPAQEALGSLTGILQDPTGAVVAGAPVTLQSETNPERHFSGRSNTLGKYEFPAVLPDRYSLVVQVQGFKWSVQDSIVLAASEQKELQPIRLEVLQGPSKPKDSPLEAFDVRLVFPHGDHGDLAGRVVYRGADTKDPGKVAPLAETQLTLLCDESRICGSTPTAADGTFRFHDLTPGLYGLRVQRGGFYVGEFRRVEVHRGLELLCHVPIEACQADDCDPKRRVQPEGIWL